MKEQEVRNIAEEVVDTQIRHRGLGVSALHLFDCPNCGHSVVATEVRIKTGNPSKIHSFMYHDGYTVEGPEYIPATQCLTCGKQFTKLVPKECWEEWVKPK